MEIKWDQAKAATNLKNHGLSFQEAATALLDPMALAFEDDPAESEHRWILLGMSNRLRLLTMV